jgi:hypothetical protein
VIQMQWIPLQEGHAQGSPKPKISSQEEPDTNNMWGVTEKEGTLEDPSKGMAQGKSSHASFAENWVTLHEIANRSDTATRGPRVPTKGQHATTQHQYALGKFSKKQGDHTKYS